MERCQKLSECTAFRLLSLSHHFNPTELRMQDFKLFNKSSDLRKKAEQGTKRQYQSPFLRVYSLQTFKEKNTPSQGTVFASKSLPRLTHGKTSPKIALHPGPGGIPEGMTSAPSQGLLVGSPWQGRISQIKKLEQQKLYPERKEKIIEKNFYSFLVFFFWLGQGKRDFKYASEKMRG